jgi:transcriptional regulator with XRE-family HTH domain
MKIPTVKYLSLQQQLDTARESLDYRIEYVKESFSDELWQAMEHRGLNQVQFSAKANVSKQFLTRVFRGSNCTIETMVKLSDALGYQLNIHLTPKEYECNWLHYLPKEPEKSCAQFWTDDDYREVKAQKSELKNETIPAAA